MSIDILFEPNWMRFKNNEACYDTIDHKLGLVTLTSRFILQIFLFVYILGLILIKIISIN